LYLVCIYIKSSTDGVNSDLLKYIKPFIVIDLLITLNKYLFVYTSWYLKPIKILLLILSVFVDICFDLCIVNYLIVIFILSIMSRIYIVSAFLKTCFMVDLKIKGREA